MNVLLEWSLLLLIVAPALCLALKQSSWLIDYAIVVLAFNRGVRRIFDYYINEGFNPRSAISLSPLLVAMLLLLPAFHHRNRLTAAARKIFTLLGVSIGIGFLIGVVLNRFAAIYSAAEWLSAFAAMAFAATVPARHQEADRWIRTAGWTALGVAIYGWWQYFTIPPWDAMWLEQSGMQGYMGQPFPTEMTLFSTMNERGPCGTFLAWAVIPMILSRRWRNLGGWLSIALILATIYLTGTRSNFAVIAIVAVLYPALARGQGLIRLVFFAMVGVIVLNFGVAKIPGTERFAERYTNESLRGEGSSLEGRIALYQGGLGTIAFHPLGLGLGSSGMGKRADDEEAIQTVGDSGYIQIFTQFGWIGGVLFFRAMWLLWRELDARWKFCVAQVAPNNRSEFIPATRALLLGSLVFLLVGDIFSGFSLIWVFFGRSLALESAAVQKTTMRPGATSARGRIAPFRA